MQLYQSFSFNSFKDNLHFIAFLGIFSLFLVSCNKKTEDVAPIEIPERLEISPASQSVIIGQTATFVLSFFDNQGNAMNVPSSVVWTSSNTSVANVTPQGTATGLSAGQTTIKATYKTIEVTALLTVVANNNQIATVSISPNLQELTLNQMANLQLSVKNNLGEEITGKTATWTSSNTELVSVNNGEVKAKGYGTTEVRATVEGIQSSPATVQVIRKATFSNRNRGEAKLKIENGVLQLVLSSDFSTSTSPPDLRLYLGNNGSNVNGAVELATLSNRTGGRTVNVSSEVQIAQYRYVLVWCKQLGGLYGVADLGE